MLTILTVLTRSSELSLSPTGLSTLQIVLCYKSFLKLGMKKFEHTGLKRDRRNYQLAFL